MGLTRRTLLGSTLGVVAGTTVAVGAAPAASAASAAARTAGLWEEFVSTPYTHPQIPYVAHAGFRSGGMNFPSPPVRANVLHYGAKPDDSEDAAPAINRAIREVGERGGGTVLLPAGTYRCDDIIQIGWNNVVLRGEGSDATTLHFSRPLQEIIGWNGSRYGGTKSAWSWSGGLVWIAPRARWESLVGAIKAGAWPFEGWTGNRRDEWQELTPLSAPGKQGDRTVRVADPSAVSAGDRVLLQLSDPSDHSLLDHMCGDVPGTSSYDWSDKTKVTSYVPYEYPVRIVSVEGDLVRLDRPLPLDARPEFRPRFTTSVAPVVSSGVAGITLRMTETPQQPHLLDKGYNGVALQCAWDCFVDDVTTVHADNAFLLVAAKACTLNRTTAAGRGHHHPYATREGSHDNLFTDFLIDSPCTHGINVEGLSSYNVWSHGRLNHGTFDTHRGLPFANVRTEIVVNNDGAHGGDASAGPLYGARFAHWNVTVTNQRAGCIRIDDVAPRSATVAISEVSPFGQIDVPDFTGDLQSRRELYGTTRVTPRNLYQAQRSLRI
ncbi:glycosyl hydrolase family 28-related protein [Streptomyces sp. NPDC050145]|uniref:glycosyl hydrolase family 28-related protein n=1 Tax=Streptomyces sp. NPDC050145 TaxID=3365602 RepID=UPI0037B3EC4D